MFVNKEDGTAGRRDPDCLRLERRPFNSLIECSTAITSSRLQASSAATTAERRQIKVDRKSAKVAATADCKSSDRVAGKEGAKADLEPTELRERGKWSEYQNQHLDFRRRLPVIDHPGICSLSVAAVYWRE